MAEPKSTTESQRALLLEAAGLLSLLASGIVPGNIGEQAGELLEQIRDALSPRAHHHDWRETYPGIWTCPSCPEWTAIDPHLRS